MKFPVFFCLALTVLQLPAFAQKGLLLYKDAPWDDPQFANATLYKEIEKFPTVHNIVPMTGGNKIRINSALVLKDIVFPTPARLADILEEAHAKSLEDAVTDWSATAKRYPASAKHLKPRIAQIQGEIARFRADQIKVAGVWMTKDSWLLKKQKSDEERRQLLAKLESEAKELDMLVEEWASMDEAQRNNLRKAKRQAEEAQLRAAEELRIQREIEKQRKLAEMRAKMKPAERLATDTWITPPQLKEKQAKQYEDTLLLVKEQLGKANQDLGFGKEAQRLVLKTPALIYVFNPAHLSSQLQVIRPEEKDMLPVIKADSLAGKEVIEAFSVVNSERSLTNTIELSTVAATDVEKLTQGLSQLIELFGKKRDTEKEKTTAKQK